MPIKVDLNKIKPKIAKMVCIKNIHDYHINVKIKKINCIRIKYYKLQSF